MPETAPERLSDLLRQMQQVRDELAAATRRCNEYLAKTAAEETEIARLRAENDDLRVSVRAFGGVWAVQYAADNGLPRGHLHPTHYDILTKAGARMKDFVRHEETADV